MNLTVVLEARDPRGYKAHVPSLPGCICSGMSEYEALENARSAVLLHFGIEEVVHSKKASHAENFKHRLAQMITGNMRKEKKQAAAITGAGFLLLIAVIWGAGFFA